MNRPVLLRPEAEADLLKVCQELGEIRDELRKSFLMRLCDVLERVESNPDLYGVVWHDVRAARLKRFRYVAYYVPFIDRVEVLAILHGSRDSSEWQARE